jgi:hypothetical protein
MKKLFYYVASVLLLGLAINCSDKKSEGEKPDRNMFGHNIPRGLTITTEGLTKRRGSAHMERIVWFLFF